MAINFKDIKKNFFIDYLKYWIIFFIVIIIYFLNNGRKYLLDTDNITLNIDRAIYVANGLAINDYYILTNKQAIDNACVGLITGKKGKFFAVTNERLLPVTISYSDAISNLILLRVSVSSLRHYAILQIDQPIYNVNRRVILPTTVNVPATFDFKESRIVGKKGDDFFVAFKGIVNEDELPGSPIFNRNYVLQGIIKEKNDSYENKTVRDDILNKSGIQKTYLVNSVNTVRKFLDYFNIEYSVISGNVNINNEIYEPKSSVVNIICVEPLY